MIGLSIITLSGTEFIISHIFLCERYSSFACPGKFDKVIRVILLDTSTVPFNCLIFYTPNPSNQHTVAASNMAQYDYQYIQAWSESHKKVHTHIYTYHALHSVYFVVGDLA